MDVLELEERKTQKAGTMSGGEQQMLAIGRAMMARPSLLLLDEPSMGIAPILVERIYETIAEINRQGTTILLVEQNANFALGVSKRKGYGEKPGLASGLLLSALGLLIWVFVPRRKRRGGDPSA